MCHRASSAVEYTGHVAVVVDVQVGDASLHCVYHAFFSISSLVDNLQPTHIDIAEQNVEHTVWPDGQLYSRRLPAKLVTDPETGVISYTIEDVEVYDRETKTLDPTVSKVSSMHFVSCTALCLSRAVPAGLDEHFR